MGADAQLWLRRSQRRHRTARHDARVTPRCQPVDAPKPLDRSRGRDEHSGRSGLLRVQGQYAQHPCERHPCGRLAYLAHGGLRQQPGVSAGRYMDLRARGMVPRGCGPGPHHRAHTLRRWRQPHDRLLHHTRSAEQPGHGGRQLRDQHGPLRVRRAQPFARCRDLRRAPPQRQRLPQP